MPDRTIYPTGLSVVYDPTNADTGGTDVLADIIFVHGLQGHPYRTWACDASKPPKARSSLPSRFNKSTNTATEDKPTAQSTPSEEYNEFTIQDDTRTFWPQDLLPNDCEKARILTWGYDTRIAGWTGIPVNESHLYEHGKVFLNDLRRQMVTGRPIIFVAHSLGGLIVKQALRIAESPEHQDFKEIPKFTGAVIFMGTPHRGSSDIASAGKLGAKFASALGLSANSSILSSLSNSNSDLDQLRDSFAGALERYRFLIKTFEEGRSLEKVPKVGILKRKVVPHESAALNIPGENLEVLDADHIQMCRFKSKNDPNYRKVGPELKLIYKKVVAKRQESSPLQSEPNMPPPSLWYDHEAIQFKKHEQDLYRSLAFPDMGTRKQDIHDSADGTCAWLLESPEYVTWLRGDNNVGQGGAMLWIKGKPGSGKSTLMKEAAMRSSQQQCHEPVRVAEFFFTQGSGLQSTTLGLLRSLTIQLLPYFTGQLRELIAIHQQKLNLLPAKIVEWSVPELQSALRAMFSQQLPGRTVIFIDALDECGDGEVKDMVRFFDQLAKGAFDARVLLKVCVSSGGSFTMTNPQAPLQPYCPEMIVERHNKDDISRYIHGKLLPGQTGRRWDDLRTNIIERACGIFLWAVIVTKGLLEDWDEGRAIHVGELEKRLVQIPESLEKLYAQHLQSIKVSERNTTLHLFQWVIFSARPLDLYEWHHIVALIESPSLTSLRGLHPQELGDVATFEEQVSRRLRKISGGLLEIVEGQKHSAVDTATTEFDSLRGGAGSFTDSQVVRVIHESVREFFIHGDGFRMLDSNLRNVVGEAHLSILQVCVNYAFLEELSIFRDEKRRYMNLSKKKDRGRKKRRNGKLARRSPSSMSLGSSASSSSGKAIRHFYPQALNLDITSDDEASQQIRPELSSVSVAGIRARSSSDGSASSWLDKHRTFTLDECSPERTPDLSGLYSDPVRRAHNLSVNDEALQRTLDFIHDDRSPMPFLRRRSTVMSSSKSSVESYHRLEEEGFSHLFLFTYATEMFVHHATLADQEGMNPSPMLERIHARGWREWIGTRPEVTTDATMMYFAALFNLTSWAEWLVKAGHHAEEEGGELKWPLLIAANRANKDMLAFLLQQNASLKHFDEDGQSVFHHALVSDPVSVLNTFVEFRERYNLYDHVSDSMLDRKDIDEQTPLLNAVSAPHPLPEVVRLLLELGANVDMFDHDFNRPIHVVCRQPELDLELCQLLINHGALMTIPNRRGATPIHLAYRHRDGGIEVVWKLAQWMDERDARAPGEYFEHSKHIFEKLKLPRRGAERSPSSPLQFSSEVDDELRREGDHNLTQGIAAETDSKAGEERDNWEGII